METYTYNEYNNPTNVFTKITPGDNIATHTKMTPPPPQLPAPAPPPPPVASHASPRLASHKTKVLSNNVTKKFSYNKDITKKITNIDLTMGFTMSDVKKRVLEKYNYGRDVKFNNVAKFYCTTNYATQEIQTIDDLERCASRITVYFDNESISSYGGAYHNHRRSSSRHHRRSSKKRGTQRKQKRRQRRGSRRA